LHNADGLTTAWDDGDPPAPNPFKYYGDLGPDDPEKIGEREFQIEFEPPETTLNCDDCTWPSDIESSNPGGGNWESWLYIPADEWVNFAVDASIDDDCKDPYSITAYQTFSGSLDYPEIALGVNVDVHDEPFNWVESVSVHPIDLPGYDPDDPPLPLSKSGDDWIINLDVEDFQTHEGIYHARIAATSYLPLQPPPDPYDNPNIMYKDILLIVGDLDAMIEDLFQDPDDIIDDIEDEWTYWGRMEGIYHDNTPDGFNIEDSYYDNEKYATYLLISYYVVTSTEYGVLRIPSYALSPPPTYPLMVFCHWGKFACDKGAIGGFGFYETYKDKFAELIPVYRGNALCWGGPKNYDISYNDAINSPADWDVDDVLAFLNVVIEHEGDIESHLNYDPGQTKPPLLDVGKVGIMGGSRGGSPTYLAKIRDSLYGKDQIKGALVTIGSVTDFLLDDIKEACQMYIDYDGYVCEPDPLYPPEPPENEITYHYYLEDYNVFARLLEPYLHGEFDGDTHNEVLFNARKRLVRSSPVYFTEDYYTQEVLLDHLQVHHGMLDELCRVGQTQELWDKLGWESGVTEFLLYDGQYHGIGLEEENDLPYDHKDTYQNWTEAWLKAIGGYS
jgi:hypothetical protein